MYVKCNLPTIFIFPVFQRLCNRGCTFTKLSVPKGLYSQDTIFSVLCLTRVQMSQAPCSQSPNFPKSYMPRALFPGTVFHAVPIFSAYDYMVLNYQDLYIPRVPCVLNEPLQHTAFCTASLNLAFLYALLSERATANYKFSFSRVILCKCLIKKSLGPELAEFPMTTMPALIHGPFQPS